VLGDHGQLGLGSMGCPLLFVVVWVRLGLEGGLHCNRMRVMIHMGLMTRSGPQFAESAAQRIKRGARVRQRPRMERGLLGRPTGPFFWRGARWGGVAEKVLCLVVEVTRQEA
jgi:hypothetical protein